MDGKYDQHSVCETIILRTKKICGFYIQYISKSGVSEKYFGAESLYKFFFINNDGNIHKVIREFI